MKRACMITATAAGLVPVLLFVATPARAYTSRQSLPVVAGTRVTLQDGGDCTAGVVLKSTALRQRLNAKSNATRYVVIAGHCITRMHQEMIVDHKVVGEVLRRDPTDDVALTQIDPQAVRINHCGVGSFGVPHCTSTYRWVPQAVGQVIIHRGREEAAVPMPGSGAPGVNETFCTSGATSGVNCSFTYAGVPETWAARHIPDAARSSVLNPATRGDSGGPVMSGSGKFYGILTDSGAFSTDPAVHDLIGYVRTEKVFQDFPGYQIAPP